MYAYFILDNHTKSLCAKRDYMKQLHSSLAPNATGRSGKRNERGVQCSGLSGEILRLNEDPATNTLAQRSWLYADDPALHYRLNGTPEFSVHEHTSLQIDSLKKYENPVRDTRTSTRHGRRSIISGDALVKQRMSIID